MESHATALTAVPGDKPVSRREQKRLAELEAVVLDNARDYIDIGSALREIRNLRLYRETHPSFETHCKDRFDISRPHAYRYIEAVEVVDNVRGLIGKYLDLEERNVSNWRHDHPLPRNEAQARELAKVPPAKQPEVWRVVIETAPEGRITAKHVRKTIRDLKIKAVQKAIDDATSDLDNRRSPYNKKRVRPEFKDAYKTFMAEVKRDLVTDWRHTDRGVAISHLEAILIALRYEV